ncbi:alpha/beta fold hydrolase [Anaerosacchariphilus polymeriproducens]|uniref:Alpha/beta hydrolase n=1 Tax=Anaerosacchariphilus polymeriproducens TaxID=1812858 RepID=A0A371AUH3_9FIRM|nr:alpha/beta hydrolase [Anaerosacchariphilus polymeriproducens]RDU23217.1 alpha/beta hydrolase [Anaerosacchariphilus polymeriproducens]
MKRSSVFKSEKGKEKIREYYNNILNNFPLLQRNIETSYGKTFILESGNEGKENMLLIHGSCSNSSAWLGDIMALSEHYHVFAVDIPGEPGNSEDIRLNVDSNEYTEWLKEVIELLGLDKVILVGNSMGGWIALNFAAEYPERMKVLVLMAPSGIVPPKENFIDQVELIEKSTEAADIVSAEVLGDVALPKEVMEFMMLVMKNFNPITASLSILSDAQMKALTMPVLYIAGTNDVTMDSVKASERLGELLPQVTLKIDEGVHVITSVSEIVIPFLKGKM